MSIEKQTTLKQMTVRVTALWTEHPTEKQQAPACPVSNASHSRSCLIHTDSFMQWR